MTDHHYALDLAWLGNRGTGTSGYRDYGRQNVLVAEGPPPILASADKPFRGDPDRWNPEQLLLAALAQCHLLSFLHVAVKNGVVVTEYVDDAVGRMVQEGEGGRFVLAFKTPDGETQQASGVYQTVQPDRLLVFSWAWKGTPERVSRISIALAPAGNGGTDLSFVHDRFVDDQSRANHERGWQLFFINLDRFVQPQAERTA